jgi:hypothetical protein
MSNHDKMRLWIQDRGWRGCVMAIALSEQEARQIMASNTWNYSEELPLRAFDLDAGFKHVNIGDQ